MNTAWYIDPYHNWTLCLMRWHWTFLSISSALFWRPVASQVISHVPRDLRKTLRLVYRKQHDVLSVIFVIPLCNGSVEVKSRQYVHFKSADTVVCIWYSYKANKCNFLLLKYDFTAVCMVGDWWINTHSSANNMTIMSQICLQQAISAISVVRIYWRLLSINHQTLVQKPSLAASV